MAVYHLEEMDFSQLKLLADKKGTFYVRDGEVFIYHGTDKIVMDNSPSDPTGLGAVLKKNLPGSEPGSFMIGDKVATQVDSTKDTRGEGHFWLWQYEVYFILGFVTQTSKHHDGTVYILRAGNSLESL